MVALEMDFIDYIGVAFLCVAWMWELELSIGIQVPTCAGVGRHDDVEVDDLRCNSQVA